MVEIQALPSAAIAQALSSATAVQLLQRAKKESDHTAVIADAYMPKLNMLVSTVYFLVSALAAIADVTRSTEHGCHLTLCVNNRNKLSNLL